MKIKNNHTAMSLLIMISTIVSSCEEKAAQTAAPPEIKVIQVIQKDVPMKREFVGQTYGLVDIPIRARVEGYLDGLHFNEGFRVKKGDLLYTIDSQPFQAQVTSNESKVAEAYVLLVNARSELNRYEPLAKINAVSQSDLDAAIASRDAAEQSWNAAKANLKLAEINLGYTRMKSPINGFIGKTEARIGEFVGREPNPVILNTVSTINQIRVQFFITEVEYISLAREIRDRIKNANGDMDKAEKIEARKEEVKTIVELVLTDGSLYEELGVVDFIDRNVNAMTGSMLVQSTFPNPDGILRPGMYGKARIIFGTREGALLVPQRCVTELQGQYSVYIVDSENTVKAKQVKATEKVDDLWMIEEGLEPGEKVIYDGLQKVATGMVVTPELVVHVTPTK